MGTTGPQILVHPEGTGIQLSGIKVEGSGASASGANIYYGALPRVHDLDPPASYRAPILCAGFDEMYFYPVGVTSGTAVHYVYGVWGNKVHGGNDDQWTVQLLYTVSAVMSTATNPGPKAKATSADSAVEYYSSQTLTLTAGYSTVLDNAIGCVTVKQDGGTGIYGVVGMPYLGGADYIIVAGSSADSVNSNAYVRFA